MDSFTQAFDALVTRLDAIFFWRALRFHIALNWIALAAFWGAVFSRKGGCAHLFFGKVFVWCVYSGLALAGVLIGLRLVRPVSSGIVRAGLSPEQLSQVVAHSRALHVFLAYAGLLTLASVRQGVRAAQTKHAPAEMRTPFHVALAYATIGASFVLLGIAITLDNTLFRSLLLVLTPFGCWFGWDMLRFIRHPPPTPQAWWYEHMGWMLRAGILLHTSMTEFLLIRFRLEPSGIWYLLFPWAVLPLAGLTASHLWKRNYRRRFGAGGMEGGKPVPCHGTIEPGSQTIGD